MKFSQLQAFEGHLKQAQPNLFAGLYLIVSKEELERNHAYTLLKKALLSQERAPELCCKMFDGETLVMKVLLDELQTLPFLSKRKLVVVRHLEKLNKSELKQLEECFSKAPPSVKLVMIATELLASSSFYKKAELAGIVLDLPVKKGSAKESALMTWIESYVQAQGKVIERRAAQLLAKQIGEAALLEQELEKLISYIGDRTQIMQADVQMLCTLVPTETIWQLGEAICRLDSKNALQIARHLLDGGNPLLSLIGQIRYQLQTGFQVSLLLASGAPPHEVSKMFPYMVGTVLDKQCQNARAFGVARFKKGLLDLAEADFKAKDGAADPAFLLERLIFSLTLQDVKK